VCDWLCGFLAAQLACAKRFKGGSLDAPVRRYPYAGSRKTTFLPAFLLDLQHLELIPGLLFNLPSERLQVFA